MYVAHIVAETDVDESTVVDWKLVAPAVFCTAKWWRYYKKFHAIHHPTMNHQSMVGYFEKSTQATAKFLNFELNSDVKEDKEQARPKKLLQDVVTRWWLTYHMLCRVQFLKKAIMGLLAAEEVSCDIMVATEWAILHQIEITLETMAHFQRVLEGEPYATSSNQKELPHSN